MTIALPAQEQAQALPKNRLCLYQHPRYEGRHATFAKRSHDLTRSPLFDSTVPAFKNNSKHRWCVFRHPNYMWDNRSSLGIKVKRPNC